MGILSSLFTSAKLKPGVYSITNRITGRVYIGATTKACADRWDQHRRHLTASRHHNSQLQADWDKYGERAFRFSVIEIVEDSDQVFLRERYWQERDYTEKGRYNPPVGWMPSGRNTRKQAVDYNAPDTRAATRELYWLFRLDYAPDTARIKLVEFGIPSWLILETEEQYDPAAADLVEAQRIRDERMRRRGKRR